MAFYLEKAIFVNRAPFKHIELDFKGNGINVLSAINGNGKTTILSHITDAFYELAKQAFYNEFEGKANKYYRISSLLYNIDASTPSFAYLRFKYNNDIIDYIDDLDAKGVNGKTEKEIEQGYELFKKDKFTKAISSIAEKQHLDIEAVQTFVSEIVERRIFDGEKLYDLIAPLELGWKDRARKEEELMKDLIPLLKRMAGGQKISGLSAYEE